jgi:hypothetical protein
LSGETAGWFGSIPLFFSEKYSLTRGPSNTDLSERPQIRAGGAETAPKPEFEQE